MFSDIDSRMNSRDKQAKLVKFGRRPRLIQKRGDQPEADGSLDPAANTKPSSNGDSPSLANSESLSTNGTAFPTSIVTQTQP
ncbi:hypothetical protein BDP27DRAFT_1426970 [Rhodocollybia butyracea]|uniref:Uncharacterized protein n=1 Tax=Rhodocollybia butyracea TaxID=206335 RepID=A0A9P5U2B7_9AGAR|nr:hypothetical protein BDP27DRAFT_1426970 [Rhodocollybia butyracea]